MSILPEVTAPERKVSAREEIGVVCMLWEMVGGFWRNEEASIALTLFSTTPYWIPLLQTPMLTFRSPSTPKSPGQPPHS